MTAGTVVIGVGNALRGDDAAGLAVAERLAGRLPAAVRILQCEQEPTRLLDVWRDADAALLVDACASGAESGTVHRFDASTNALPARTFRSSTHSFGVGDAVELARALGELPRRVVVYGIEGTVFTPGSAISAPVAEAVERVARSIASELAS